MAEISPTTDDDYTPEGYPARESDGPRGIVVSPRSESAGAPESTRAYVKALYCNNTGMACMAFGTGPYLDDNGKYKFFDFQQLWFEWPQQADELTDTVVEYAQRGDVYLCTSLMRTSKRSPGNAANLDVLHADVDNGDLHLDKVRQLGGWAVASGTPGNGHVYVPLSQSLSPEQFSFLESALKVHLGADSKIAANDVLRPVGTLNHKPTVLKPGSEPTAVAFLIDPDVSRMEPEVVAQILGVDLSAPATVSASKGSTTEGFATGGPREFDLADDRYWLVRQALTEVSSPLDRSEDTMRVIGRCYDAGLTLPQARWAVNTRADLAERIDGRNDDDVLRCWLRVDEERRESGRLPGAIPEGENYKPIEEFEKNVRTELDRLRVRGEARRRLDAENRRGAESFDAGLLEEILDRPDTPQFRISEICPADGGMLIVAQRKTGKTTLTLNLARCLLTGETFLGRFPVNEKVAGRVGLLNYEVSASQLARWANDVGVPQDRLLLVNLRGRRNPLGDAEDRERLVELLRGNEVESLIVDPFGRAFTGNSQNDSGEVGTWLQDLDLLARGEVGARDVILTAHAGWKGERTRGSSALEDWADSVIMLTANPERRRFIRAFGRDVDVNEDELTLDPVTRVLGMSGSGGSEQVAHRTKVDDLVDSVCTYLKDSPGSTTHAVVVGVTGRNADVREALNTAVELGLITKYGGGPGKAVNYWLAGGGPE